MRAVRDHTPRKDPNLQHVRQMLETLTTQKHSLASDIWAFGITVFEIVTAGKKPYAGWSNAKVYAEVSCNVRSIPRAPAGRPMPLRSRVNCSSLRRSRRSSAEVSSAGSPGTARQARTRL